MKNIPNILSGARIALSLLLPLLINSSTVFLILYLICGATDALDGFIARRYYCASRLGAALDSIADIFMFAAVITALIVWMGIIAPVVLWLAAAIAAVRTAGVIISRARFGRFAILHTLGNKITGALLFLYPVEYLIFGSGVLLYPLFAFAYSPRWRSAPST